MKKIQFRFRFATDLKKFLLCLTKLKKFIKYNDMYIRLFDFIFLRLEFQR